ncbi:uncharacterized protein LTHEOB_96 [Lasiodiplodia theobromae]|uniref:uncharacterized protein n=1 Tax=Lasiodiplodia theobromae TaxID=45133 RepID=UPI0015C40DEA|nr:uncharacterized protein LTHEOB_96 [Lasiodiplodia theobromae]KAF4543397.1 hypothetical protein LTHEOB_96 [Lasiodiplodia theobromae]
MQKIELLEAENSSLRTKNSTNIDERAAMQNRATPRFQTLYRLDDNVCLSEPSWNIQPGAPPSLKPQSPLKNVSAYLEKNTNIAFVIYKDFSSTKTSQNSNDDKPSDDVLRSPEPIRETIKLTSDEMVETVKEYLRLHPDFLRQFPGFDLTQELSAPYVPWYYARTIHEDMRNYLSPRQQELMSLLTERIWAMYGEEYRVVDEKLENGIVSLKLLDYFVRPDDVLLHWKHGQYAGAMATSWTTQKTTKEVDADDLSKYEMSLPGDGTKKAFLATCAVSCWYWGYDGQFHQRDTSLEVRLLTSTPDEEVEIRSLPVYPLRYAREGIQELLRKRGETRWACRTSRLVEYFEDGLAMGEGERHMIDNDTFVKLHPDRMGGSMRRSVQVQERTDRSKVIKKSGPVGDEIYLFEHQMAGYNMRLKKWVDINVDLVRDVSWDKKAFDALVLGEKTKELIEALIRTEIASEKATDIIRGKGRGLIMLLHGGPGTGKTFTAETVAEIAEKPLYRVTCSDISTDPEQAEKYLEAVLHLGKIWGCIVLLDEADVFLEERSLSDIGRNALVSMFLRVLEYYDGILILTSNRVGTFDEAFKSRIQLALHYKNLTEAQRKKIWRNFLNRLRDIGEGKSIDLDDIRDNIDQLAKYKMNGRQIRNSITTARQLAAFRKKVMSYEDLEHVISVAGEFEDYLRDVKEGVSDDQAARADGRR